MPSGGPRPQRTNTKPMPVSGPGRLSQRTDMIPSGGAYGERKAIEETLAAGNRATPAPSTASVPVTALHEPTQLPDQPITAGNPLGPGPGLEAMNLPQRVFNPQQTLQRLASIDESGQVELVLQDIMARGL